MKVEMLDSRLYRGEHMDIGRITDMDDATARMFIAQGWARVAVDAPVLTTEEADALIATKGTRRRAIR